MSVSSVNRRLFNEPLPKVSSPPDDSGIDSLYASFSHVEQAAKSNESGAFTDPVNRAFGYRCLIDHLLRHEVGNKMGHNGSIIPKGRLILAREKFQTATEMGVFEPDGATEDQSLRCSRHRDAIQSMLDQAGAALEVQEIDYEAEFETPDEDVEKEYAPTDKAEAFEQEYWRTRDVRLVKIKA